MASADSHTGRSTALRALPEPHRGGNDPALEAIKPPSFTQLPTALLKEARLLVEALPVGTNVRHAFDSFCSAAFVKPEWAPSASDFLAETFAENEDQLAELARIPDLVIELTSGSVTMTCIVASRWAAKGENHRLVRLAEAMIAAHSKMQYSGAVDVMLALTTSLAVTRFPRAEQLFGHAQPLADAEQADAVEEARQWLAAGKIVRAGSQEIRDLWEQRLRRSRQRWNWSAKEERQALLFLVEQLDPAQDGATLFQAVVPECWWDLLVKRTEDLSAAAAVPSPPAEPLPPTTAAPSSVLSSLLSHSTPPPTEIKESPATQSPSANSEEEEAEEFDPAYYPRWNLVPFFLGGIFGALIMAILVWLMPPTPPPSSTKDTSKTPPAAEAKP